MANAETFLRGTKQFACQLIFGLYSLMFYPAHGGWQATACGRRGCLQYSLCKIFRRRGKPGGCSASAWGGRVLRQRMRWLTPTGIRRRQAAGCSASLAPVLSRSPMSLYRLKPRFQALLRPFARLLYRFGATANQVTLTTLTACAGSLLVGGGLALSASSGQTGWFLLLPGWFFLRMALNAIDGMLAREFGQRSRLGAYLNELC